MANIACAILALQFGQNWTATLDHPKHRQSLKKELSM